HFSDLGPIDYFSLEGDECLRAVGWLDRSHPFPTGSVEATPLRTLTALLRRPWEPVVAMGFHGCNLCQHAEQRVEFTFENDTVPIGASNLFIPADDCVLVAPSLILHYIATHWYRPPDVFLDAVVACPDPQSMEYKRALLRSGARTLVSQLKPRSVLG
ncbi:MAG: hypothetical protein AAFQ82_17990, partial [Myxococcota bacterium]